MTILPDQFDQFFQALWDCDPFPWQSRLNRQVCNGRWPDVIGLPTASGKTACLDVAVFALAVQASLPPSERVAGRRIFFVVNRRVIVDEAFERAMEIAWKLREAKDGSILRRVADALRRLSGASEAPPLDVAVLRGGLYRDNRWARSISQPTIITSTVDQVGSRLLFRGYGVSDAARPLHAALVANDSVLLLDEAHISQPFLETLEAVRRYRAERWARQPIPTPFVVVPMTATPASADQNKFCLDRADHEHPTLSRRITSPKPVRLLCAKKARGSKAVEELAEVFCQQATDLLQDARRTVAVIVNRVATARRVYDLLKARQQERADVYMAIGRMRPLDRDAMTQAIQARVGKRRQGGEDNKPLFVVATQCLEVGADFDFDAMACECASLDALRQRFGRLNRKGLFNQAQGCVVIRADQEESADDPIYGAALSRTWQWLKSVAENDIVDFAPASPKHRSQGSDVSAMLAPQTNAPVMFPAYVDAWSQTNPAPAVTPDIALFLHGPKRGEPDVQVCWRDDLPDASKGYTWANIVSLCPPSSPECMPVPIGLVRAWLAGNEDGGADSRGDVLGVGTDEVKETADAGLPGPRAALLWRGPGDSALVTRDADIRPGDTLVMPVSSGTWSIFGHVPDSGGRCDIAEEAFQLSRDRAILRLTPERLAAWPQNQGVAELRAWINDPEADLPEPTLRDILVQLASALPPEFERDRDVLRLLADRKYGLKCERYPEDVAGIVLTTGPRRRIGSGDFRLPALDDGDDETSRLEMVSLKEHTDDVRRALDEALQVLPLENWRQALVLAVRFHDLGKTDERFQALLLRGDMIDACAQTVLWAKSAQLPMTPAQRAAASRRSRLPSGFRHEMLSMHLATQAAGLPSNSLDRDLVLHLVASHHGYGRPFAPVVIDNDPPDVSLDEPAVSLSAQMRRDAPAHRLDSGVAHRFWSLTRQFGWWGLAYLESVLRLADQRASQLKDEQRAVGAERTMQMEDVPL